MQDHKILAVGSGNLYPERNAIMVRAGDIDHLRQDNVLFSMLPKVFPDFFCQHVCPLSVRPDHHRAVLEVFCGNSKYPKSLDPLTMSIVAYLLVWKKRQPIFVATVR